MNRTPDREALAQRLRTTGINQEHVLRFWGELSEGERGNLAQEINRIDLPMLFDLFRGHDQSTDWHALASRAESPPAVRLAGPNKLQAGDASECGADRIRRRKVGMILVAGGQGTRLGFPHPKGMFPIGPVSNRTLFQVIIEHLLAVANRYGVSIPLYIMTSPATHDDTVEFLRRHENFGLAASELRIFSQGTMPALDAATGKLLMSGKASLALSPDGHGGMLQAFMESGAFQHAQERGLEQIFYGQIDNPLLQVCSRELIGHHCLSGSELTTQVVRKRHALERVGNVVSIDGVVQIIEYSDLPASVADLRDANGDLKLWAGNLAVHVFDLQFLARAFESRDSLPFHRARKKVAFADESGCLQMPESPNGLKFERFIFDLLPLARNAMVVEADPAQAFAPVKNAEGEATDTPSSARAAISALHRSWMERAGVEVAADAVLEISPFLALSADDVKQHFRAGDVIRSTCYLQPSK